MGGITMEEQLVSLEVAKLLKDKGFNIPCESCYVLTTNSLWELLGERRGTWCEICTQIDWNNGKNGNTISAPTQSIVAKWLREKHNFHIIIYNNASGYGYEITKADNGTHISNDMNDGPNSRGLWDTYEEALEAGLLGTLKLIKK